MTQSNCNHEWKSEGNYLVCSKCSKKTLDLKKTNKEGLLQGIRKDGNKYSVRENRMGYFMPGRFLKFVEALKSPKAKLTAEVLIQLGCRINEARHIEERDIDYERNTIRLRITKTKAKKGEKKGKPRTIPINSKFIKRLKKHFSSKKDGEKIGLLTTSAFNLAMKKALVKTKEPEGYMLSAHNIRKTHGNWLKIMGNLRLMEVDPTEICLRLGHDYNTFLRDYGSSGVMDNKDVMVIQEILGDLYRR